MAPLQVICAAFDEDLSAQNYGRALVTFGDDEGLTLCHALEASLYVALRKVLGFRAGPVLACRDDGKPTYDECQCRAMSEEWALGLRIECWRLWDEG